MAPSCFLDLIDFSEFKPLPYQGDNKKILWAAFYISDIFCMAEYITKLWSCYSTTRNSTCHIIGICGNVISGSHNNPLHSIHHQATTTSKEL